MGFRIWRPRGTHAEAVVHALFQEHGRSLLAYATRLTGDHALAEDVVQETLLRAWRHAEAMDESKGSVRGWLLTVARNIVTDWARARAARPREVEATPGGTVPLERDHAQSVVDSMAVMDALDQLSPAHREVLFELYYRGRSVAEAADRLSVPAGTVKSRTHHALRALRALMQGSDGHDAA